MLVSINGCGWSMRFVWKCGIRFLELSWLGGRVCLREYMCICLFLNRVQLEFWGSEIVLNFLIVWFEDVMKEKDEGGMVEFMLNIVCDIVIVWYLQD